MSWLVGIWHSVNFTIPLELQNICFYPSYEWFGFPYIKNFIFGQFQIIHVCILIISLFIAILIKVHKDILRNIRNKFYFIHYQFNIWYECWQNREHATRNTQSEMEASFIQPAANGRIFFCLLLLLKLLHAFMICYKI